MYPKDRNIYRPLHIYLENQIYFLTVKCYNGYPYFRNKENIVIKIIDKTIKEFNYGLYTWVILESHLHLLFRVEKDFKKFIHILNGRISYKINRLDKTRNRQVIYQYWDRCIRNEKDFWKHFNYIHNNPIKHRYVKNLNDLSNYQFSSFNHYLRKQGREWTNDCFSRYPIVDFSVEGDK